MGQSNFIKFDAKENIQEEGLNIPAEDPPEPAEHVGEEGGLQNAAFIQFQFPGMENAQPADPNAPTPILVIDLGAGGGIPEICQAIMNWGLGDRRGFIRYEVENQNGTLVTTRSYPGTDERVTLNEQAPAPEQSADEQPAAEHPVAEDQSTTEPSESAPQLPVSNAEDNKENEQ